MTTTISEIIVYPVKSLAGVSVQRAIIEPRGLQHDRRWAIVNAKGAVMTAREHPAMLALQTELKPDGVYVSNSASQSIIIPFEAASQADEALRIFSGEVMGFEVDASLNAFFSDHLGVPCRLMGISEHSSRAVQERHGGKPGDEVAFADDCPLLLANEESLDSLNNDLTNALPMRQFRANIVVSGAPAWSESDWKSVRINESSFEVAQQCKRCNLATIDPETCEPHPRQEPLRTMARTRPRFKGGVAFGIHLTPRELQVKGGTSIQCGDVVQTKIG